MTLKVFERNLKEPSDWHRISGYSLQVSQSGFGFMLNNYFLGVVDKLVQQLTSTGVIEYLVDSCFDESKIFPARENWSVLTMDRLSFGFNIWLGFCTISVIFFIIEILFWIFKRKIEISKNFKTEHSKTRFAKIHQEKIQANISVQDFPKDPKIFQKRNQKISVKMDKSLRIISITEPNLRHEHLKVSQNIPKMSAHKTIQ